MPDMNTLSVAAATTPTVLSVSLSHYLTKSKHRGKPTYHIGYHQGLELVRRFLTYASHRTVEELQAFTAQYVPVPTWVHVEEATISETLLEEAAEHLVAQLGPDGVERVGGKRWWRWRVKELKAEWIEMRRHYWERLKHKDWAPRTILYVHGGGRLTKRRTYSLYGCANGAIVAARHSSVDEHRYQLQRHARKMKARVFAPRYRLAPQFPFPCLQDILASYLYLLSVQPASTIILSGDSAGGGAVAALLCILRDQNIPLPAGSILISPWVDLTHSFPSVISDNSGDYIPAHGFLHKSSPAWPPPTDEDIEKAKDESKQPEQGPSNQGAAPGAKLTSKELKEEVQGFEILPPSSSTDRRLSTAAVPKKGVISILIEGHEVRIKDQIQLYTTNELLSHPLVSPVLQGSLGGLPPMMILVGGSEVLRDEQIYFAHKAANPRKYPPPSHVSTAQQLGALNRWKHGTDVYLQIFDDCCHVTPTLSFTKPAKYMYRSIAKFGDWLFAREALQATVATAEAANTVPDTAAPLDRVETRLSGILEPGEQLFTQEGTQIVKGETMSIISSSSSSSSSSSDEGRPLSNSQKHIARKLATATPSYDVPTFMGHMVRQRVDRKGNIHPLPPVSELPCMQLPMEEIGCIKPEPVRRWMEGKKAWDSKYAKAKKSVQAQRAKEIAEGGYLAFEDDGSGVVEKPPPSALAGRRKKKGEVVPGRSFKPSYGLKLWSMIGSKQDAKTIATEIKQEEKAAAARPSSASGVPMGPIAEEEALSSSSSGDEASEATMPPMKKTQSQIDRLEAIASVPDAVLVDSPPGIVDVSAPFEKLGQEEEKATKSNEMNEKTGKVEKIDKGKAVEATI
ncbi:hypothetical protein H072_11491 [Dactylellina haptotyla CBS 200.50]|uniref:Alpha/beta hydrolase fold-3 domain-containing protein n=1 Tax=Dactylellina haptotyla (strain CBS 200.50) TaxID=1284197 RepID=S7ZXQ4_DACHA|nr:hypothetical protein H072_11491 [Dactylellina haptotyla CBS 200.50]